MKPLDELTAHCIRCGFCLESCPTFLITGEETESPRGRIYLVRSADEGKLDWEETRPHLMRCLGCFACETACPSGVEYGQIFEIARDRLESAKTHHTKKALLASLTDPGKVRLQLRLGRLLPGRRIPGILSRLLSGEKPEANRPVAQESSSWPPLDESSLPAIRGEVYLLEGCVMRVLFPRVHEATRRLLRRIGYAVREAPQGCCGSLPLHAGYLDEARARAASLIRALPGDLPVIVDSAGCGSTMKGYGEMMASTPSTPNPLLIFPRSERAGESDPRHGKNEEGARDPRREKNEEGAFASRVFDASEFLLANGLAEELRKSDGVEAVATYHDACHLAHGQGIRSQPRDLLRAVPGLKLMDLNEADMCCGSAGIYNLTQPKMARELLERKWRNVETTGASIVAMGNPGCHAWIAQAAEEHGQRIQVLHTMELLESSFVQLPFRKLD